MAGIWDQVEQQQDDPAGRPVCNPYLDDPCKGMQLLASVLAVQREPSDLDALLQELVSLIDGRYMDFARREDLANEAEAIRRLTRLRDKVEEAVHFRCLQGRSTVALGGQFSSGKSSLVNALLKVDGELLPVDTLKTTAVPTYIASGPDERLCVYNVFRNSIVIDRQAFKALSHHFAKRYGISLSGILRFAVVESPDVPSPHLIFLDTPGYNAHSQGRLIDDNTDASVARRHLAGAHELLWLIDCEHGTVPKSDLDFLRSLQFGRPIFFLFTKADRKPEREVMQVLDYAGEILANSGLQVAGVAAYSAHEKWEKVSTCFPMTLSEHFAEIDQRTIGNRLDIAGEVRGVFSLYREYHSTELRAARERLREVTLVRLASHSELPPKAASALGRLRTGVKDEIRTRKGYLKEVDELEQGFLNVGARIEARLLPTPDGVSEAATPPEPAAYGSKAAIGNTPRIRHGRHCIADSIVSVGPPPTDSALRGESQGSEGAPARKKQPELQPQAKQLLAMLPRGVRRRVSAHGRDQELPAETLKTAKPMKRQNDGAGLGVKAESPMTGKGAKAPHKTVQKRHPRT